MMVKKAKAQFLTCTAMVALVGVASESQAIAQNDVPDANGGGESSASSATPASNVIIVTARKREESLVEVPLSMSVVSGDQLDAFAIRDVQAAARLVPNLHLDEVAAGPRVAIRGLGNAQTGGVVDSSVGLAHLIHERGNSGLTGMA